MVALPKMSDGCSQYELELSTGVNYAVAAIG